MYERYLKQKELSHHGILGQKWGVRRFQNKDGSLTQAGKARVKDNKSDIKSNTKKENGKTTTSKQEKEIFEDIKNNAVKDDIYGGYIYKSKSKLNCHIDSEESFEAASKVINNINDKKVRDKLRNDLSETIYKNDTLGIDNNITKKDISDNLKIYYLNIYGMYNDKVSLEIYFEHRNFSDKSSIYGDHSIDVEGYYDLKKKKILLSNTYSING